MSYRYWIIRYVPNIARGEFTNIGIVCGRDTGDWAVRFETRAVRSSGNLRGDLSELRPWITWFTRSIERHGSPELSGEIVNSGWINRLRARQANSVQFSEPNAINVTSAMAGIDLLFPHLIEREPVKRSRALTRTSMRAEVREILQFERGLVLGQDLFVQRQTSIGKQRSTFDFFSLSNGSRLLTNVWTFNAVDVERLEQQVQASNYFVTRLRSDGAELQLGPASTVLLDSSTPASVIYDPPAAESGHPVWRQDVFEAAQEAWSLNGIAPISLDDFRSTPHKTRQLNPNLLHS